MALTAFQTDAFQRTAFQAPIALTEDVTTVAATLASLTDLATRLESLTETIHATSSVSDAVVVVESVLSTAVTESTLSDVASQIESALTTIQSASMVDDVLLAVESLLSTVQTQAAVTESFYHSMLTEDVSTVIQSEDSITEAVISFRPPVRLRVGMPFTLGMSASWPRYPALRFGLRPTAGLTMKFGRPKWAFA